MKIIYTDNHLLVINKKAGVLVQGDSTGRPTLFEEAKEWIKTEYNKPGKVYLGLVHRLDRLTSGIIVFARTSKAAARLSDEIRNRRVQKTYRVMVAGKLPEKGEWIDQLKQQEYRSAVVKPPAGQEARLAFTRLAYTQGISIAQVALHTGRKHQIRVQFAHRGFPVLGDKKYGSQLPFEHDAIALHAYQMEVKHPTRDERMIFKVEPNWHYNI